MIVDKRKVEGQTVLRVEGIVKLGESAEFLAQTLRRALDQEEGHVLLDLSAINYIDSTGIGELVGYLTRFRNQNRKLILINPSPRITKLLGVAQVDSLFPTYGSVEDAVAAEK
ncbi:MAG TPA: STAS domain-containing protein [Thermoanaerobaculia bacterium]